jgi:hypothetical protein
LEIALLWIGLAVVVGVAADTRGRDGAGWGLLAIIISPLLAGLLLIALPRKEKIPRQNREHFADLLPGGEERKRARLEREQIENDRREGVFRPDGMIENTPYRVLRNGEAEAMIQGGIVRFQSLDHLRSMLNVNWPAEESLHFRNRTGGIPYEINPDSTVTAKTPIGVRTFSSWADFLRAIEKQSWEPPRSRSNF